MTGSPVRVHLADEDATSRLGEDIAAILRPGDALLLSGDLGMGKTTLARAVIRALAGDPALDVPSPTFTMVQSYPGRVPVHHFDLYRLAAPDELEELGLAEALGEGAVLVEWPERAEGALPAGAARLVLSEAGDGRDAEITGPAAFLARLSRSLAIRAFLDGAGLPGAARRFLTGDASARAYETVSLPGRPAVILMDAPRRPDGPPIRDGLPYSRIAHLAESVTPFVAIAGALRAEGFCAPEIYAADLDRGLLLVENLGAEGVLDGDGSPVPERYIAAAELLAEMHARDWPRRIDVASGIVHEVPPYDRRALAIETELLTDWYLPHVSGRPVDKGTVDEAARAAYGAAWAGVFDLLEDAEKTLVLRDYHSPNLIWRADREGRDRVGLIDFQDAVIGPAAYDVASLAMDARVDIPPELERSLVEAYCAARAAQGGFDRAGFDVAYAAMAAQRNSKILGIFVRLNLRDGKPGYMRHLPRIRDYLSRALAHPALGELRAFYAGAGIL
ncbi:MAG: tRNA (adenosine(37)-N6)-threonylcarbamoyltransferase complex ATPase subunit type 1 TsaE [Aquamicrobium sp.]|uniref:tRNA (adenosine(37)-N6)-threonylcarbamoyltransferase complex ATPase subunit type 1 TsaE n=1 Tax=Aquamicrobium sp. TaxID=1872579 RepID=UPI00349E69FB|nr:tRNA (adenosine(37)-N6)-threonylcarbamoyltransferase complex ATPase subunit type 1 TsaE [Aquamicrobium sp.]